jgi:hypothetical protein
VNLPDLGTIVALAAFALLLAGALAPLETLGWWAGWSEDELDEAALDPHAADADESDLRAGDGDGGPWVVFLTGIHAVGPITYARHEADLLNALRRGVPRAHFAEVFPYSVTNRALTGERIFAGVWRWALTLKASDRALPQAAAFIINLRNLWQVLVSADRRYGPIYNRGSAELIVRTLHRLGYPRSPAKERGRIVLIGYSGGAQIAAGAVPFIRDRTRASVEVISLGGVLAADPGILAADRFHHVIGAGDGVARLTAWLFPGRWRGVAWSPWNVARARGTLRVIASGPHRHTGAGGYLDAGSRLPDGMGTYHDATCRTLIALLRGDDAAGDAARRPAR